MKSSHQQQQSSKLYQADLYDQIKTDGNHIICLGQDQTKTYILLAAIRNLAHQLHEKYGSSATIIILPDKERADERQKLLSDHTELNVVNLFDTQIPVNGNKIISDVLKTAQIILVSLTDIRDLMNTIFNKRVNLVIFDYAHFLLAKDVTLIEDLIKTFDGKQILVFMCSLIHNNHELTPLRTVELIDQLETIFNAKCETSSDLRSLSRQSPITNMEIIEFNPSESVTCDMHLLADSIFRNFCELMLDTSIEVDDPMIEPELGLSDKEEVAKAPLLNLEKQLVLVRSCLSDVLYALHCLGLWCAKKTVQMYITEFSRLLANDAHVGDLIAGSLTILNCFYGRLDEVTQHYQSKLGEGDIVLNSASEQLKALVENIKEAKPNISSSSWPLCIVHVRRRVIAKVVALWLDKISNIHNEYSFIKANYIVGSSRKHRNRMTVDNFDLHHEASVRDFRYGNCNTLVTSAINEQCTNMPRCNLVVSFDLPTRFFDYIQAKGNCRYDTSKYVIMLNSSLEDDANQRLLNYINMERLLNNVTKKMTIESEENQLMEELESEYPPYPNSNVKNPATIWRSLSIIHKYCTKLPSDSFTKLSPDWSIKEIKVESTTQYYCELRLPINSPVRQTIVGPMAITKNIAIRLAAYTATKLLHKSEELDDNMMPITKESMKIISPTRSHQKVGSSIKSRGSTKAQSIGSTKHRQYYRKRIAEVFSGPLVAENIDCYLYKFNMVLTCPIPDEQNRRGRRIIDPSETNKNYAIVCTRKLPKICSFPVFTRSGEVLISVILVKEKFKLTSEQVSNIRTFHEYTFSKVLRLEKYPTIFDPDNSVFTVLLAPVIDEEDKTPLTTNIDWKFVDKIINSDRESCVPTKEERKAFKFNYDDYVDAVVIPWYRLFDRQQFAYYVAEICTDLTPNSPFPDEVSGFKTFIDYYSSKYNIEILHTDQPVLDVDHTSARLNLLTPRYVNRKGRTLPSSTAKTRKESRESLVQKQLLIPELCSIHPFPASFWRKAVCLPCIFYRLNSLFLAEELRRKVALDTQVGFVEPPEDTEWPALDFGWSLKDVINCVSADDLSPDLYSDTTPEDDSWSISEDDNADTNYSDDEVRFHGEWKDSKAKNRQLLRELFLPICKYNTARNSPSTGDIESLYNIMKDYFITKQKKSKDFGCPSIMNSIQTILIKDSDQQQLINILNDVFADKLVVLEEDAKETLEQWYGLLKRLTNKVETTLLNNPDLFIDNGIELVTVDDSFVDCNLELQPTFGELLPNRDSEYNWTSEDWKNIKFDPTRKELKSNGPGPSIILQALTMSNASDGINLERLETVGDSFLKYSITAYLYCMYPTMHEGKLSYLRSTEISNANLYQLGKNKNLGEIMSATKFEPNDNWLAPGYTVAADKKVSELVEKDGTNTESNKKREIDKALAEVPYDLLLQHSIPDKSIADSVEALIGAYLTASGSRAALLFMDWLGLKVVPPTFKLGEDLKKGFDSEKEIWRWLDTPSSPLICLPDHLDERIADSIVCKTLQESKNVALQQLNRLYYSNNLDKFEQEIGYSFNDKAYVVQAFTHNSFHENQVTDCHQRLEFLGDALLDYLITRYLFEDPRCHSPGTLTDLRSALVNNTFFASLAVKYKFHKYLRYNSDELFNVIDGFVKKFRFDSKDTITKGYTLLISEGESEYAEDIEVPKALGDVFESVAGAIYLDSGMSLDQVWRVYFKMMKPEIEYFSSNVPKSPIRELLESMPQNVRFSPSELAPDKKHRVIAEVFGLGRFTGVGRNKHSAKSTAAKRALRMLALRKKESEN